MLGWLVILLLLIWLVNRRSCEGLTNKPNDAQISEYTQQALQNAELFKTYDTFYKARDIMPWLDAPAYEDLRKLYRQNKFNADSIQHVFH